MATKTQVRRPAPAPAKPDRAQRAAPQPVKPAPVQEEAEVVEEQSTALTTYVGGGVPSFLLESDEDDGAGLSTEMEDNLVPSIVVLQAGSPQCKHENPDYIDGAQSGMIWLRNYKEPLLAGSEGIVCQLCCVSKGWTEWLPRNRGGGGGKGFVARYPQRPPDAKQVPNPENPKAMKWVNEAGNDLSESRQHVIRAFIGNGRFPFVINMAGSNHRVAKSWMTAMNQDLKPNGRRFPIYAGLWMLTTKYQNKNGFDWYMWELARVMSDDVDPSTGKPRPLYVPSAADREAGKALQLAFQTGAARGEEYEEGVIEGADYAGGGEGDERGEDDERP